MVFEIAIFRLEQNKEKREKIVDENILSWAEEAAEIVRDFARNKGLTGFAVESIHAEKTGYMKASVFWGLKTRDGKPLDKFLEDGTDPHIIEARFAEYLTWLNEQGKRFFRKKVKHPGTTAMNIFKDARKIINIEIKKTMISELNAKFQGDRIS